MKRWLIVLLPSAVVLLAAVVFYFYYSEQPPLLMAETLVSADEKVRVLEYAPDGKLFSDYLVYRCEYYHRGHMWSCASFTNDSYKAEKASIEIKADHVVIISLDGHPTFELDRRRDPPFKAYWKVSETWAH